MNTPLCSRCDFSERDIIDGKYSVVGVLGEGTFGKVYLVRCLSDGALVALKLLKLWSIASSERAHLLQRFTQEYETGLIKSDYLVQAYSYGYVGGNPYIVMEYCPCGDLLHGVETMTVNLRVSGREVLLGLAALHSNGRECVKVHRDLKPVKSDGRVALTDFGIAGDRNRRLTSRGIFGVPKEVLGTYAYMPPEQVNPRHGEATVLPTTDLFSFGVMMYQLLTGVLPFGELTEESDLYSYVARGKEERWDRERLSQVRDGALWEALITGCLRADFRERIASAEAALALMPSDGAMPEIAIAEEVYDASHRGVALRVSTNSTYLNGHKVESEWYLQNGDEIQLSTNGPKLGFIIPAGDKGLVKSIGMTARLNLFRQQALRPYKTALAILGILLLLACGASGYYLSKLYA